MDSAHCLSTEEQSKSVLFVPVHSELNRSKESPQTESNKRERHRLQLEKFWRSLSRASIAFSLTFDGLSLCLVLTQYWILNYGKLTPQTFPVRGFGSFASERWNKLCSWQIPRKKREQCTQLWALWVNIHNEDPKLNNYRSCFSIRLCRRSQNQRIWRQTTTLYQWSLWLWGHSFVIGTLKVTSRRSIYLRWPHRGCKRKHCTEESSKTARSCRRYSQKSIDLKKENIQRRN